MDWFTQGVITGVVGNVLTGLAGQVGVGTPQASEAMATALKEDSDVESILAKAASEAANVVSSDKRNSDKLKAFLSSPEARSVIRQVYSAQMMSGEGNRLQDVEQVFHQSLERFLGRDIKDISKLSPVLFDALVHVCNHALESATKRGVLAAQSALTCYQSRLLQDELANVNTTLNYIGKTRNIDLGAILDFELKYRKQVGSANKYITPPSIEGAKKVPIDQLFVPSSFSRASKKADALEELDFSRFLSQAYRAVILGNPGGGKSTFARKLCHDLALHYQQRLFAGRDLTPIFVVLRDYGAEKKSHGLSLMQFMELNSNSDYQVAPPAGAFEYLLLSGRSLVIFDGLDELLETSDRQRITRDVELFADLYPSVPIIVTSREVGYEQAPLDEEKFEAFRLAPFSIQQTTSYVQKWFSANTDLSPSDRRKQAASFLRESEIVPDLRSNPLMLALMCTIYRGEGTIPHNRPDLYGKCAEMLFEKWDKRRGIHVALSFEAHVRPAMNHLAAWIYADEKLQAGVTEAALIEEATKYLSKWSFDDVREAESAAHRFIDFCTGRAWVFTDTGTRKGGERLYQFTHRTFLEYFTAVHLVQTYRTPSELGELLHPHIIKREWDVVAQLAFQLKGRSFQGDTDNLLSDLLTNTGSNEESEWSLLLFANRCLEFMVPTPPLRRTIARESLTRALKGREGRYKESNADFPEKVLGALFAASEENRAVIADAVRAFLIEKLQTGKPAEVVLAAEVSLDLSFPLHHVLGSPTPDLHSFWQTISKDIEGACDSEIRKAAETDSHIANTWLWRNKITLRHFIAWHGTEQIFEEHPFRIFSGIRLSLAENILRSINFQISSQGDLQGDLQYVRRTMGWAEKIGQLLLSTKPPWANLKAIQNRHGMSWKHVYSHAKVTKLRRSVTPTRDALFGFLVLFAVFLEDDSFASQFMQSAPQFDSPAMAKLRPTLSAKLRLEYGRAQKEASSLGLSPEQFAFVNGWIEGSFNLVRRGYAPPSRISQTGEEFTKKNREIHDR
jgi:NACHT domain